MFQDPTNTAHGATSSVPGWRTNPDPAAPIIVPDATLTLLAPPSAGEVDVASAEATVSADGDTLGDVVITPTIASAPVGGSGTFSPTSFTINSAGTSFDGFTFTPDTVGDYSIGISNDRGLTDPAPFTYQAQSPYVAPELENNWLVDLHPLRTFVESQDSVPVGSVDHAGESNAFNAQTQTCGSTLASKSIGSAGTTTAGTLDADSLTRNAYEWLRIQVDPDNGSRNCYAFRLDKTASNWTGANIGKSTRAQIPATGNPRRTRPWGDRTWFATAVRIPSLMRTITNPGFIMFAEYHTSANGSTVDTGGDHVGLFFNPGGATPENSSLKVTLSTWSAPNWSTADGGSEGTKHSLTLFAGGSNPADQVPIDTWIFFIMEFSLWHGYPDLRSSSPVDTPTGSFYVKPYVASGDAGALVAKTPYTSTWGYPYEANSTGWAMPAYPVLNLYTNPKSGSNWTTMEVLNLGMREWLHSDIEAENPGRTITAHDILAAFKASRLVTP